MAALQEREQQLGRQLTVCTRQLTAAQEDGEADRIRLLQAEDEILSLQVTITHFSRCLTFGRNPFFIFLNYVPTGDS